MIMNQRKLIVLSEEYGSDENENRLVVTCSVVYNGKTDTTGTAGAAVVPAKCYGIHPKILKNGARREATTPELERAMAAIVAASYGFTKPPFGEGIPDLAAIFSGDPSWLTSDFLIIGSEGHTLVAHETVQPIVDAYRKGESHK